MAEKVAGLSWSDWTRRRRRLGNDGGSSKRENRIDEREIDFVRAMSGVDFRSL